MSTIWPLGSRNLEAEADECSDEMGIPLQALKSDLRKNDAIYEQISSLLRR